MNLVERVIKIITKPKEEWDVIQKENAPVKQLFTNYVLILAVIPAIALFVKYGLIGVRIPFVGRFASMSSGISNAITTYIVYVGSMFIIALIVNALADAFKSEKDLNRAFQLVAFSFTPFFIASIFRIVPFLGFLSIAGLYGYYIMYLGLEPMMKTKDENKVGYFIVIILISAAVFGLLNFGFSFANNLFVTTRSLGL